MKPFDPESEGIVERANQFLETSFLPGRSFTSVADFNEQLAQWLPTANSHTVRSLRGRPIDRLTEDRAAMLAVPPPPPVGFSTRIRLPRDYYVRVFGNDYSVDPSAFGRMIDVHANLTQVIASHERSMGSAATITDPEHVSTAKTLRVHFQTPAPQESTEPLDRNLADYDATFFSKSANGPHPTDIDTRATATHADNAQRCCNYWRASPKGSTSAVPQSSGSAVRSVAHDRSRARNACR